MGGVVFRKKSASAEVESLVVKPLACRATRRFFGRDPSESDRYCLITAGIPVMPPGFSGVDSLLAFGEVVTELGLYICREAGL